VDAQKSPGSRQLRIGESVLTFVRRKDEKALRRVLVLGSGKMANAFELVLKEKYEVYMVGRPEFDACTPASVEAVIERISPQVVCNAVVSGGVDQSEANPIDAFRVNALFPAHLAKLSKTFGFHFVHISSEAVFPNAAPRQFFVESSAALPCNVYGMTKFSADCLVQNAASDYYILRLPLLFGPNPKKNQFLEKMIALGLKRGQLSISNDIYSNAAYSIDVARQLLKMLENDAPSGLYHVAGASKCSLFDLVAEAVSLLRLNVEVVPVSHVVFSGNATKNLDTPMRSELIAPLRPWDEALREYCLDCREKLLN
jgi:dTDP-4-dehydrorhamnose reductase